MEVGTTYWEEDDGIFWGARNAHYIDLGGDYRTICTCKKFSEDLPGGPVVKNLPYNAGTQV